MLEIKITLLVINVILWMVLFGAGFKEYTQEKIGLLAVPMDIIGTIWCFKQGDDIMGLLFGTSFAIAIIAQLFLGMIWAIIDDIFNITND